MKSHLLAGWIYWCFLCGGAGLACAAIAITAASQYLWSRYRCQYRRWRGRARREESIAALERLDHCVMHIDRRIFSRGIWKELHFIPAEDEAARLILVKAWHEVLREAY